MFDALTAAKALERAGMENGQAEAVATVIREATAGQATKATLKVTQTAVGLTVGGVGAVAAIVV